VSHSNRNPENKYGLLGGDKIKTKGNSLDKLRHPRSDAYSAERYRSAELIQTVTKRRNATKKDENDSGVL